MNFDRGWGRIEKLVLICGLSFAGFVGFAGQKMEIIPLGFVPWLTLKLIKWLIDGFRDKKTKPKRTF